MLAIEFSIIDLGSTDKGLVYPSGQRKGAKSLRHSLQNCKASLVRTQLLILGEHGNIRYAPRGLREQHEVLLVFTGRRFESYYLNGGARYVK